MDDALKLATPLTNGAINETLTFHKISVATHLTCDGILNYSIIINFLLILTVK